MSRLHMGETRHFMEPGRRLRCVARWPAAEQAALAGSRLGEGRGPRAVRSAAAGLVGLLSALLAPSPRYCKTSC